METKTDSLKEVVYSRAAIVGVVTTTSDSSNSGSERSESLRERSERPSEIKKDLHDRRGTFSFLADEER